MKRKNAFFRFLSSRFFFYIFSRAVSRGESKLTEHLEEASREGEKGASKLKQIMKWPFPPLSIQLKNQQRGLTPQWRPKVHRQDFWRYGQLQCF